MIVYNTLTRKKEKFKPIGKIVKIYSCGLTVYDYGHIGNFRSFVFSDLLKRYLEYLGYKVYKIVNITDVDDKTIKGSIKNGEDLKKYTLRYEKAFFEDGKKLNIRKADKYPRATENIKEMIKIIEILLKKGYAYKEDDGIYFNVDKFKNYGKLSKKNLKTKSRIENKNKKNKKDFALWKFYTNEDGNVFWESKFGKGRPGWHIECSAMSSKYLGQPFDIHTGGIDLIFPHHENEIAQSECAFNKKFVNYWLHNAHVIVNGKKMSKSLGNYFTLRDIIKMGFSPLDLRYFYLTGHYRKKLNFTLDNLKNSQNSYRRLKRIISELKDDKKINKEYLKKFEDEMNNDLDSGKALRVLWNLIRDKKAKGKINTIKKIDKVFGLDLLKKEKLSIPKEIKDLIEKREKARKEKNFELADKLREEIRKKGYSIDDTKEGTIVNKL